LFTSAGYHYDYKLSMCRHKEALCRSAFEEISFD
jgi:hypothetical protein